MKQLFLTLVLLFSVSGILRSQDFNKIRFGLNGGYNYSLSRFITNKNLPTKAVSGGYFGAMLKIPFDGRLFFTPQMDVSYRGMQTDSLQKNQYSSIKELHVRVMQLLQIDFKHPDEKKSTLFVHFGPSIGFGINGKQVAQNGANSPIRADLKYGFQSYGRYDASWHTGIGYESVHGFRVLVDYAHGLGNMINLDDGALLKYRIISAGIGYWF